MLLCPRHLLAVKDISDHVALTTIQMHAGYCPVASVIELLTGEPRKVVQRKLEKLQRENKIAGNLATPFLTEKGREVLLAQSPYLPKA